MALGVDNLIGAHFTKEKGNKPKGGVLEAYIGNWSEIDFATSETNAENTEVTAFALTGSAKIYKLEGCEKNYAGTPAFADRDSDFAVGQNFTYTLGNTTRENLKFLSALIEQGKVFVIYKTHDNSLAKDTNWRIIGYDSGLAVSDTPHDLNVGTIGFTIGSKANQEENLPFKILYIEESSSNVTEKTVKDLVATA